MCIRDSGSHGNSGLVTLFSATLLNWRIWSGIGMTPPYLRDDPRIWHDAGMAFSKKLLSNGEYVVLSVRSHGKALIWPVVVFVVVVGAVITALMLKPHNSALALAAAVVAVPVLVLLSLTHISEP